MMKVKDALEIKLHLEALSQDCEFAFYPFYALHTEIYLNLISLKEETHENIKCSTVMKKVKVNEEANEKNPCIKSECVLSGDSSFY